MQNKNGHYGESANSRADKMSGIQKTKSKTLKRLGILGLGDYQRPDKQGKFGKKFYGKKRRMFLNNPLNNDKI